MQDPVDAFHPLVAGWFRERFGAPTEPQRIGWPRIAAGEDVLIAAPTGSGKTLAAFLACLDALVRRGMAAPLPDGTAILYVSPLKALSNDVHRNLEAPLAELAAYAAARGERVPEIRVAVRTGDTPASERAKLAKRPPHILVTTPESLFILLTSEKGRASLAQVRTVIVDEIHAVAGDKRGAHLAISLERLDRLVEQTCGDRPVRVGLSATQRPIERIARLLVGTRRELPVIVDNGHRRELDLAIEITDDELGAVASNEQFGRVYDRIAALVAQHRSTIVFVNTRRLVERVAAALEQRLGEEHVVAHHGSMSRALRLAAEQKLKHGQVKCAVATASLELGIDVGAVDLVVQLGSPRAIATLLQRVGRSGHHLGGTPKGRLFALTRDQLVECAALIRGVRRGNLDEIELRDAPLDILAQQIVAAAAAEDLSEDELAAMIRGAAPYAQLSDARLEQVLAMLCEGVSDRRGRSGGAHLHRDRVHRRVKGRRGARLAAITSGGAIPDNNNYAVVQFPDETPVGTVDEDFAIDSSAGDIFQLGNTSWRIRRIEAGRVLVEDAKGLPPTIPFWFGEAPARTKELSDEVSALRGELDRRIGDGEDPELIAAWLAAETCMPRRAAQQLVAYLAASRAALGALPRKDLLIAERFFDEGGGMQLVLHSPLGGRINRAWGLALRKKFCRTFDFELQASATDDGIVISLGQPHSFPLDTVFGFISQEKAEHTLVQALLDRPMFEIRWRWNVTRSLTVLRRKNGKKIPPHLIKMRAADTLSVVFPAAQACPENLPGSRPGMPGDREIPDHPLVFETIRDCLVEAMDVAGFRALVGQLERGEIQVMGRDTVEPSPLSHELLNANPYAFLDDAPLEERRTRAVSLRRGLPATQQDVGVLDDAAIAAATEEVRPIVRDVDELHDALLALWLVPAAAGELLAPEAGDWFRALASSGRACQLAWGPHVAWVATERLGAIRAVLGDVACTPMLATPAWADVPEREQAILRIVGAHLDHRGPVTAAALAGELGLPVDEVLSALLALETDGAILRGRFTSGAAPAATTARAAIAAADENLTALEWCNRRVLARIHRLTLARLRKEIEPVSAAALMRFLLRWQRVAKHTQLIGADGLARVIEQLQGFETAAGAWEREVLPARLYGYDPAWLDQLCLAGQVVWCRLSPRKSIAEAEAEPEPELASEPAPPRAVAPPELVYGEPYDLAEAGAEAARLAGASREAIAAAAAAAIAGKVPPSEAQIITSLVTTSAMLRQSRADGAPGLDDAAYDAMMADEERDDRRLRRGWSRVVAKVEAKRPANRNARPEEAARGDDLAARGARTDGTTRIAAAGGTRGEAPTTHGDDPLARGARTDSPTRGDAPAVRDFRGESAAAPGMRGTRGAPLAARGSLDGVPVPRDRDPRPARPAASSRSAPSRSAPLAMMLRHDVGWLRAAAAIGQAEPPVLSAPATRVRDHLAAAGASFLADLVAALDVDGDGGLSPDDIEDALWELVGAGLATADGFASLRVLVDRKRGEVKSLFDRGAPALAGQPPVRKWQEAIRKARTRDRGRPGHALRSLPTAAGRWSLLPRVAPEAAPTSRPMVAPAPTPTVATPAPTPIAAPMAATPAPMAATPAPMVATPTAATAATPAPASAAPAPMVATPATATVATATPAPTPIAATPAPMAATPAPAPTAWTPAAAATTPARTPTAGTPAAAVTTPARTPIAATAGPAAIDAEASARQLLHRYGVVFRDLLARESSLPPWRDLLVALRRLEARGEIRGGRFVTGFVGEQFALPEALDELRAVRNPGAAPCVAKVAATDPLNLVGVLTPGPRVPAIVGNAVLYVDGQAVASLEAGELVVRAALPPGARVDADLTYHPPPRPSQPAPQAALPL